MNCRFKKIRKEWERTIMTAVLVCILLVLGAIAYSMMSSEQGSTDGKNIFRTPKEYFDTSSKLYLEPPALDGQSRNAMTYSIKLKIPPAKKTPTAPQTKPENKPEKNAADADKKQQPAKTPAKPQAKKTPQAPPVSITVKYRGCMQLGDQKPVAFCTSTSSKDKKPVPASLKKGDKVHGILLIDNFDGNTLTLSHDGKNVDIPKGKEHVFTIK